MIADDGRTKPTPRPVSVVKSGKSGKGKTPAPPPPKPRSDSSSGEHQEFSCLIRATFKGEKISSVVRN